jgi:hypothetical protein
MHQRTKLLLSLTALACLLTATPGCVIRRGWIVKCDWRFEAKRTGCRHRWFGGRCRQCPPAGCDSCEVVDDQVAVEGAASPCGCHPRRGLLHREKVAAPAPEPPAPSTFHPVPMRPVFGARSEEADGYEAPARPLTPPPDASENIDMDGEPIDNSNPPVHLDRTPPAVPEEASTRPRNVLRTPEAPSDIRRVSWKSSASAAATSKFSECPSCSVRFRER